MVLENSTFSRRERVARTQKAREQWRLPVATDVVLARIGLDAGFESAEIWIARSLRPRNVKGGEAGVSVLVLKKAEG